ncbi:MAG: hypothetical protein NTU41_02655 [Chloroflexi bacterium]|nr:hypothetical protein [Chloroflexota bacterium]
MVESSCTHHWLIERLAVDGSYHGRCKKCGAEHKFQYDNSYRRGLITRRNTGAPVAVPSPHLLGDNRGEAV